MSEDKYVSFNDLGKNDIFYRNFAGRPSKYHPEGGFREFCVAIRNPEKAERMRADGWPVKSREIKGEEVLYISVKVRYDLRIPPIIEQKTSNGCVRLEEDDVAIMDVDEIISAKMRVRGWEYEPGKRSVYLVRMEAEIEDEYSDSYDEDSYDDVPF